MRIAKCGTHNHEMVLTVVPDKMSRQATINALAETPEVPEEYIVQGNVSQVIPGPEWVVVDQASLCPSIFDSGSDPLCLHFNNWKGEQKTRERGHKKGMEKRGDIWVDCLCFQTPTPLNWPCFKLVSWRKSIHSAGPQLYFLSLVDIVVQRTVSAVVILRPEGTTCIRVWIGFSWVLQAIILMTSNIEYIISMFSVCTP